MDQEREFIESLVERWGVTKMVSPYEREEAATRLLEFMSKPRNHPEKRKTMPNEDVLCYVHGVFRKNCGCPL